jgi:antitoxin (DNA-binding transcriptional repressor) of toxin-antitoxin stability system
MTRPDVGVDAVLSADVGDAPMRQRQYTAPVHASSAQAVRETVPAIRRIVSALISRNCSSSDQWSRCDNVHMKTISIRELHLKTGQWVRHAASRSPIVVTDRGRRVATLQPFDASVSGRPLPNREAAIRKRSKVPVDSVVYQAESRGDR